MSNLTDVYTFKEDVGKNLYRKKTYYTLVVEQDVLAKDKDEADQKFLDDGGVKHSAINKNIVDASDGVETYVVDANQTDSDTTKYIGKVKYVTDTYNQTLAEAIEAEDIYIDTYADEDEPHQLTKSKLVETPGDLSKFLFHQVDKEGMEIFNKIKGKVIGRIQTSKGCVARCTFCQRAQKGYRPFEPKYFEEQVINLKNKCVYY